MKNWRTEKTESLFQFASSTFEFGILKPEAVRYGCVVAALRSIAGSIQFSRS